MSMITRLRIEFVGITMIIISAVIFTALGSTYLSSYSTLHDVTHSTLMRGLESGTSIIPRFGNPDKPGGMGNLLVVTIDQSGTILGNANYDVNDADAIDAAINHALESSAATGEIGTTAWAKEQVGPFTRIAITDIALRDQNLTKQAATGIMMGVLSIFTLSIIVWTLSNWILRPLRQAWDRQRRFISDASHELKTPLAVLLANAEILSQTPDIEGKPQEMVHAQLDEAKRMRKLVEDLLELARADEEVAGTSKGIVRRDVDLSYLVDNEVLEFEALAFDRGCTIEAVIDKDLHIQGDPDQLQRVCRTLIDNATKYAAPGTIVSVDLHRGKKTVLTVRNYGSVVDPKDLPHLFDRFYRTDTARTTQSSGGYGLGLAIAKAIVENHGGKISVSSDEKQGTCFTVCF